MPVNAYSSHSLRRDGASWAIQCGIPSDIIKLMGDWKSDAYLRYLVLPLPFKVNSVLRCAKLLPSDHSQPTPGLRPTSTTTNIGTFGSLVESSKGHKLSYSIELNKVTPHLLPSSC